MSRLSDDEKRVFTDKIISLEHQLKIDEDDAAHEIHILRKENTALRRYAVLLDKWFDIHSLPIDVTRTIGAARKECAALLAKE